MTARRRPNYSGIPGPRGSAPYGRRRPDSASPRFDDGFVSAAPNGGCARGDRRRIPSPLRPVFDDGRLHCGAYHRTGIASPCFKQMSLVSMHLSELRAQDPPAKIVRLPGFPVAAGWNSGEVQKLSPQALTALLDERAATEIYLHGTAAFSVNGGNSVAVTGPLLSGPWALHQALFLLNARTHAHLAVLAWIAAGLVIVLLATLWLQVDGYGRLVGAGIAGLAGALLAGTVTLFVWLASFRSTLAAPLHRSPLPLGDGCGWPLGS